MFPFLHLLLLLLQFRASKPQQLYENNKQLDCTNNSTSTLGYECNGVSSTCTSYLTFRTNPSYNNPFTVGRLIGADAAEIARMNSIEVNQSVDSDTLLVVPLSCSCLGGEYYQHNASYVLQKTGETIFSVANNTYQGLTTCQSMLAQNPLDFRNLVAGMKLNVPIRCACPTSSQTSAGYKYLLAYLVDWGDNIGSISNIFSASESSILAANQLTSKNLIFPFTTVLVPLKTEPLNIKTSPSTPPPPPQSPPPPPGGNASSSKKWVFVGVGVGVGIVFLILIIVVFFYSRRPRKLPLSQVDDKSNNFYKSLATSYSAATKDETKSFPQSYVRDAIGSLTVYRFEELEEATGFFGESNRIDGSVYRGSFKGDEAAVKVMKGDVSTEINVLKHINHSNIIRLSGFCLHQGSTYLVYEFAQNGSLNDWLHHQNKDKKEFLEQSSDLLGWKQRIQIAYDAADALNYLHNYANPPYIHKNLKSTNILLDANMRGKLVDFGLSRAIENKTKPEEGPEEGGGELSAMMTRHVVGTYGYMAPEYIENGLITPKLDIFALGVVVLELLSGKEAAAAAGGNKDMTETREDGTMLLSETIEGILDDDEEVMKKKGVREKLQEFMDPLLGTDYPLDLAYSVAQLAKSCVSKDLNHRPTIVEVMISLSKILAMSLDWDPTDELERSQSQPLDQGR